MLKRTVLLEFAVEFAVFLLLTSAQPGLSRAAGIMDQPHPSLTRLLNPDGASDQTTGLSGNLDIEDWERLTAPGAPSGFVPSQSAALGPSADSLASSSASQAWDSRFGSLGTNAPVTSIAVQESNIYVGGYFTAVGGLSASHIARWNGRNWSPLGSGIAGGAVFAVAASGSNVYVGGAFDTAGGVSVRKIAKWDGRRWSGLGSGIGTGSVNDTVFAIAVQGNSVYAGGIFSSAGGVSANNIARWDGSRWSALGDGITGSPGGGTVPTVYALATSGSSVYAGGFYTNAGHIAVNNLAQWNGRVWGDIGRGVNGPVYTIAVNRSGVFVGGQFATAGGVTVNNVARWNGTRWLSLAGGTDPSATVNALGFMGGLLFAGGGFTTVGGVTASHVAQWNGSQWSALDGGVDNLVTALGIHGNELFVGGDFTVAGGKPSLHIGLWK